MNAIASSIIPDVSVVLISYNDAARLPRALAALQHQSHRNIEIIVVDDASTDGTSELVAAAAAADDRIRQVVLTANSGGCSGPRNRGIDEARGTWVMFCDSDDEYTRDGVAELMRAAEQGSADLGCGVAERFYLRESRGYPWRPELHEPRIMSTIMDFPDLIADTICVNKIYRRSWLIENGIRFPEGLLYEDQLFTMEVFTTARKIVVIPETTYRWNVAAESNQHSITQRRTELRNVENRIEINRRIDTYLTGLELPGLMAIKSIKFLTHDLPISLAAVLLVDDEEAAPIVEVLADYARDIDVNLMSEIPPINKVAVGCLLRGDIAGIRNALRFLRWTYVIDVPITNEDERQYWGTPIDLIEPALLGREARWWREVTALGLQAEPFSRQRLCHLLIDFAVNGDEVTLSGSTVDPFTMFDKVVAANFVMMQGANVVLTRLPMAWEQVDVNKWKWRATGSIEATGLNRARIGQRGVFGVELQTETEANVRTVHIGQMKESKFVVAWPGRFFGRASGLTIYPSRRGTIAWRSSPSRAQLGIARILGGGRG